jgi:DNA-binding GntR family transcriptional regulator
MFVADISSTDLQKIFEVRMLLEGFCARLAAQRASTRQLAQMEQALDELERVPNCNSHAIMAIDSRLHELLYEAADNEFLADSLERLHALSLRLWYLVLDQLDDVKEAVHKHQPIFEALQAGDEDRAERLIREHIAEFQQEIRAVL